MNRFRTAFATLAALAATTLALAALPAGAAASAQAAWLAARALPLPAGGAAPLPALPARLLEGRVILLGEVHGLAHGQVLDLAFLKALHRQAGVRHYLGEFDAAQADAFNRLLRSGDRQGLDAVFAQWQARGLQWANADFRDKLLALARWNRTLPAGQRVRFLGADEVQDRPAFCRWLGARLDPASPQPAVAALAAALRDPARCDRAGDGAQAALAQARGLDAVTRDGVAALAADAATPDREARIVANVRRHLATQRGRFYGLWGLFHVVQAEVNASAPLALQLQRAGVPVRSVAVLNLAGEMMIPTAAPGGGIAYATMPYTVDSAESALVHGIEPFAAAARGPLTLFMLAGRGSPFRHSDALTRVGGRLGQMQPFAIDPATAPRGVWADAVVVSRGSRATRPLP